MVDSKRYNPSNKRFQEHTQHFVQGTTKKGHLTAKDDGDKKKETGELKKVEVAKIYQNGWLVYVDKKKYNCSYGDNIIYMPPYTVSKDGKYYVPKKKCTVEVSIDTKSKIYTITKINDSNKKPISMTNNGVTLEGKGLASLKIEGDDVKIKGKVSSNHDITTKGSISSEKDIKTKGSISSDTDVKINTKDDKDLPDEISVKNLYKRIQVLEKKISDSNGS